MYKDFQPHLHTHCKKIYVQKQKILEKMLFNTLLCLGFWPGPKQQILNECIKEELSLLELPIDPIWSILFQFDQDWSNLFQFDTFDPV